MNKNILPNKLHEFAYELASDYIDSNHDDLCEEYKVNNLDEWENIRDELIEDTIIFMYHDNEAVL